MTTTAHPPTWTRRRLRVPRADALGWDIPLGYADDPPHLTGRAALAARCLARAFGRSGPDAAAWIRRHALRENESRFSFWSPEITAGRLRQALDAMAPEPDERVLGGLVETQLAQARGQHAVPHLVLFRAMDKAAWGRSAATAGGDADTLAAVLAGDFGDYLCTCLSEGRLVQDGTSPPAAWTPDWKGDLVRVDRPGLQCRVAVQRVLAPGIAEPAASALLADYLDGPDGLVQRRLRTEAGIAYGAATVPHQDGAVFSLVVAASMLVENLDAGLSAIRALVAEIGDGDLLADRLDEARRRARHKLLGQLDGPFGSLEESRRVRDGLPLLRDTVAGLDEAAGRLARTPRWSAMHRPAVCFIGDLGIAGEEKLEAALC
jgi:hypothetical protein